MNKPVAREVEYKIKNYRSYFDTDIFLASYPKSGNTWVRFLIANILNIHYKVYSEVTFENIEHLIPAFPNLYDRTGLDNNIVKMKKVHFFPPKMALVNKLVRKRFIYIIRNPVDVMKSYYLYQIASGEADEEKLFGDYVIDNINSWVENVNMFSENSNVVLFYDDLIKNPLNEMENLMNFFEDKLLLSISNDVLESAINLSSKENMIRLENDLRNKKSESDILFDATRIKSDYYFVNKGDKREVEVLDKDLKVINHYINKIKNKSIRSQMARITRIKYG